MSIEVKVGQVWEDKDKRRGGRRVEILSIADNEAHALVVGTENETSLKLARLTSRWTFIMDKDTEKMLDELLAEELEEANPIPAKPSKYTTREQWLQAAVKELTKLFTAHDIEVPEVRVSVGWPGGRGKKTGVVGQCFATSSSDDKVAQIFVSPAVSDTLKVTATLLHELIHAVDDCKSGHKKDFIRIGKLLGFVPEWTSSDNRTDELNEKLKKVAEKLGEFPHAAIRPDDRPVVQKTYMLKVLCPDYPDYFIRMTAGKIEEYGTPLCPCHHMEMEVEEK